MSIGVRAEGGGGVGVGGRARGAAAPPQILGNSDFFGQQEKVWAKPAFKDVSMFF